MIANSPHYSLIGERPSYCLRSILSFFSSRVLKGGPRILLYLALCFVGLIAVMKMTPERTSGAGPASPYSDLSKWEKAKAPPQEQPAKSGANTEDAHVGGLRMVVFGENDIASPPRTDPSTNAKREGWTEMLCAQLQCSSYLSLIPTLKPPHRSLVSNNLFAAAVEDAIIRARNANPPGADYSFVNEQYPVSFDLPDFSSQIAAFLSMPAPKQPPKETLWIFNFGFWDIWSMAALPRDVAHNAIDSVIKDVFVNVERLYQASLNSSSIAFSDYNQTASPDLRAAYRESDDPAIEPFRLFIPQIFDPTLTPAWTRARKDVPKPHSKAEHMRNAASLTERWNQGTQNAMKDWIKKDDPRPAPKQDEGEKPKERRQQTAGDEAPSSPQLPLRDGITFSLPDHIIPMIIERHFQIEGMEDSNGVGRNSTPAVFTEVTLPCIENTADLDEDSPVLGVKETKNPVQEKKKAQEAASVEAVKKDGEHKEAKRSTDDNIIGIFVSDSTLGRLGKRKITQCDKPDEHLFHDAFTLSRRAIEGIAKKSADLIRRNETSRAAWERENNEQSGKAKRAPGPWRG